LITHAAHQWSPSPASPNLQQSVVREADLQRTQVHSEGPDLEPAQRVNLSVNETRQRALASLQKTPPVGNQRLALCGAGLPWPKAKPEFDPQILVGNASAAVPIQEDEGLTPIVSALALGSEHL
jgi:hypothetical protein